METQLSTSPPPAPSFLGRCWRHGAVPRFAFVAAKMEANHGARKLTLDLEFMVVALRLTDPVATFSFL